MRLFIDSSVLFSACHSRTGGARELIRLAIKNQVELFISDYVLVESERHLSRDTQHALAVFHYVKNRDFWRMVTITREQVAEAIGVTADKFDAPIVAAARAAKVDYLLSFDRKHLYTRSVETFIGSAVATPETVLKTIKAGL